MNGHASAFRFSLMLVGLVLIITLATTAPAQDLDEVTFTGVVTDAHGAVIPDARVTARLVGTGAERTATTDGAGRYRLIELAPGAYTLRAESAGFAVEERREVLTLAGQTVRIDFRLRPGGLVAAQTIVSAADAPALDVTRTVAGGTVVGEELRRLPLFSGSPLDSVFLLGGVTEEPLGELYS